MKTVAMIPARLGSKRIPKKNLRILNGKPLISHIIEAAIEADCFDEIYINSESDIFEEIANSHKIKFYKRPDELSTDSSTNDDFVLDFINKNNLIDYKDCNIIQILPTSPFLTPNEIKEFVNQFNTSRDTTLVSVTENKIECLFEGEPINFDRLNCFYL